MTTTEKRAVITRWITAARKNYFEKSKHVSPHSGLGMCVAFHDTAWQREELTLQLADILRDEGKDLFTGALVDRVKATTNQERNDYNFLVDFTDTDEGVEMSISCTGSAWKSSVYTREQLRQLSDAINAYLAK